MTIRPGTDEILTLELNRRYLQHLYREIEQHGRAILWDKGILKKAGPDADTDLVLEPSIHSDLWQKRRLFEQGELVGKVAQCMFLPGQTPIHYLELHFPAGAILERIAGRQNSSPDSLRKKFCYQLYKAFHEMIGSGEGRLPDFGTLHFDDSETPWFTFRPEKKRARFFEETNNRKNKYLMQVTRDSFKEI